MAIEKNQQQCPSTPHCKCVSPDAFWKWIFYDFHTTSMGHIWFRVVIFREQITLCRSETLDGNVKVQCDILSPLRGVAAIPKSRIDRIFSQRLSPSWNETALKLWPAYELSIKTFDLFSGIRRHGYRRVVAKPIFLGFFCLVSTR